MTRGLTTTTVEDFNFGPIVRHRMARTIRVGALRYLARPFLLDVLDGGVFGLSTASPRKVLAILDHLEEREMRSPRRWIGFGGEVPLINIKAAKLATRWSRRFGPIASTYGSN